MNIGATDEQRMDRHYKWQRLIYDATRTHYLIGRQHLIAQLQPASGETVLEIGCGTAWNLIRAANRYPHARFAGIDVSNAMLATARASVARKALTSRVTLAQGDATNFDPQHTLGQVTFDRVFFSYALSMIPHWEQALEHAMQFVAPGGSLHIVDFGQCENLPPAFKSALFAFLRHYTVRPRDTLDERVRDAAQRNGCSYAFDKLHRGYTHYARLHRAR